jgi:hypothetical protein
MMTISKQFVGNLLLPIRSQSAPNPLSLEANWNQINYGSGLGKAQLIKKSIFGT